MRTRYSLRSASTICVLVFIFAFCPRLSAAINAGCAKTDITPANSVWLSGYASRDMPSDGILDKLFARALVLNDGANTIAIVSVDLLWVPMEITNEIRQAVKQKIGIDKQNVLICATHTHFGPKLFSGTKINSDIPENTVDEAYVKKLIENISDSVVNAHSKMQPARIGAAKGYVPELVFNRRPIKDDGTVQMTFILTDEMIATGKIITDTDGFTRTTFLQGPDEPEATFGPIDPDAWVLRVEDVDGQIIGSVVNYACHAVSGSTYPDWFNSISADYPGQTVKVIEQAEGGICLFTSGAAGNIVPIRRGQKPRFQIGKALAGEALRRLQFVQTSDEVSIKAMKAEIKLPLKQNLSPDRILDTDITKEHLTTEIQAIRLGDIYILALPGEVLVEVGLEIKQKVKLDNFFVISLSNDTIGYVCPAQAYKQGGYEPDSGTNMEKGTAEIIIKQALELIGRIKADK